MRKLWARMFRRECEHPETMVVRSVGVERTICETCGHMSFTMSSVYPHPPEKTRDLDKVSSF